MKFSVLILFFTSVRLLAQPTPIDVAENTLKISDMGEEIFYYGLYEGDQLLFNFQEVNKKELKEVKIIEYPSSSKFIDYKTKKIDNKTINITKTGIYIIRFSNSALLGRICKFKVQRISFNEQTKNFNTCVYWKTMSDTTYTPKNEKYLVSSDTSISEIYSGEPQISSKNALNGNSNHQIVDISLPVNTVSWSFHIGTGKAGKKEYDRTRENFTNKEARTVRPLKSIVKSCKR